MRLDNMIQSLRVLAQADSMIADVKFRSRLSQIALHSAAFFIALFGLIMLGIAGYLLLRDLWGPIWAAMAIALASFAIAGVFVLAATFRKPGKELDMAREMHTVALDSLIAEAKLAGNDLSLVNSLFRGRLDTSLLALIGPLASLLLRLLKKSPPPHTDG